MRRLVFGRWVGLGLIGTLLIVGACGLDENGLEGMDASLDVASGNDTSPMKDAGSDAPFDVVIPPACTTLDATACLDADVPDGWTLVGLATSNIACPQGDAYAPSNYLNDLQLEAGACSCSCTASGSYSCAAPYLYAWGGGCNGTDDASFDGGDEAACVTFNGNDHHFEVFGTNPSPEPVNVGCDATAEGTGWFGAGVTTCTPSCAADYCNIASPFSRCIISTTETVCPAPFQASAAGPIGPTGAVQVECTGCGCSAAPIGGCDASFSVFGTSSCGSFIHNVPLDFGCQDYGANSNSFSYTPSDPPVGCALSGGGGKAVFNPPITVCCLPP